MATPIQSFPATMATDSCHLAAGAGRLAKATQEFEAILLERWLEKMNESFVGKIESQDPAHDTVSSLGTQAIAQAMATRGGIGIARMLLQRLQPHETAADKTTAGRCAEKNLLPGLKFPHQPPIAQLQSENRESQDNEN